MIPPPRKKISIFLFLTFAFSSVFYYFIISSGSLQPYNVGLMWCPGVGAILTQLIFHRSMRGLGWLAGKFKYLLLSGSLPMAYGLAVYGIAWLTGLGKFAPEQVVKQVAALMHMQARSPCILLIGYLVIVAPIGLICIVTALGEEIGWRGLLVPELSKEFPFTATALISGIIWVVWHYPLILFANYNNPSAPAWFGLICFTVMLLGMSFAFAWLRLKSGSLWTAALLHGSNNLFIQIIFTPVTGGTGMAPYVIGEFGAGLALAAVLVAYLFWRKRRNLPTTGGEN